MTLYSYYRSSCAYRARIALNMKGLDYTIVPVHLVKNGGEQHKPEYAAMNPQELVPTLVEGDFTLTQSENFTLTQSWAIMEYLEEKYPAVPLLPKDLQQRAYVRQIAMIQVADIHPINNLRILNHLSTDLGVSQAQKTAWYHKWVVQGFDATEKLIARSPHHTGTFVCGDQPTLADICLVPQVYNALRYEMTLDKYPLIRQINDRCLALPAFDKASPDNQPDTPDDQRPGFMKGKT